MEKLINYSCIIICALTLFIACSGKGEPLISDVDKESYLSVDVSSLKYDGKGGSNVITIKSNTLWVINSSADWLSFSINSGKGDGTVSVSASANTNSSSRSTIITIIFGQNQQRAISITQEGNAASESLNISPKNINIDGEGGDAEVTITTDASWTVVCEADWLSFSKKTGIGDFTLKITAQKNTKEEIRKATVIILYGDNNSVSIDVTQEGKAAEEDVSLKSCPDTKHPHWIDLGLPSGTKWRCCNEGASTPEAYGDYFTFGQVSSAPTKDQIKELVDNCTYEWTTQNGVNGGKFTGPNGGSIFLPATGNSWDDEFYYAGSNGHYWSSSLTESRQDYAWYFYFYSGHVDTNDDYRYFGHSVRPVR